MATKVDEYFICKESFVATFADNSEFVARKDKTILDPADKDDARILKLYGKFFKPVESSRIRPLMESATAAPGELRGA